jgi:hypothetical protein
MDTLKQKSLRAISRLSDKANVDEIMYRLYVIDKINKGKNAIINGKIISVDNLKKEIKKW